MYQQQVRPPKGYLINIFKVTLFFLERLYPLGGILFGHAPFCGSNLAKGKIDILGHPRGISTNIKIGSIL
jgi:hypothetical protein